MRRGIKEKDEWKKKWSTCSSPVFEVDNYHLYVAREKERDGSWRTEHDELRLDWRESFTISGAKWSRFDGY